MNDIKLLRHVAARGDTRHRDLLCADLELRSQVLERDDVCDGGRRAKRQAANR